MNQELHEQFFNAVKNQTCPLCAYELDHEEHRRTEKETLEFFSCENCGSSMTMIFDAGGNVDFEFEAIIGRGEKESCEP